MVITLRFLPRKGTDLRLWLRGFLWCIYAVSIGTATFTIIGMVATKYGDAVAVACIVILACAVMGLLNLEFER